MDAPRTPPHHAEAEAAIIAGLLQDPAALDLVAATVTPPDFYRQDTRAAFAAIARLAEQGKPFDVVAVAEALEAAGHIEAVGGLPGLGRLASAAGSSANCPHYATLVAKAARSRGIIAAAARAIDAAHADPPEVAAAALAGELDRITAGRGPGGFRLAKELIHEALEGIERRWEGEPRVMVPFGLCELDHALSGGLEPGQLAILAARPAMGKSALAAQAAAHAAKVAGPVAYFSLEMDGTQVMERLLSAQAGIKYHLLRSATRDIEDYQWPLLTSGALALADLPLHIADRPGLTLTRLRAECRRLKREAGSLAMVVVDYLGLMDSEGRHDNRVNEVSALTRGLKLASMELETPFLVLAQLNRGLESRPNKRPLLADLRESGSIEQDADVVIFIYRDEVYHEDSKDKGIAELGIAKQRNGPCGTVKVAWRGAYAAFADLIEYEQAF